MSQRTEFIIFLSSIKLMPNICPFGTPETSRRDANRAGHVMEGKSFAAALEMPLMVLGQQLTVMNGCKNDTKPESCNYPLGNAFVPAHCVNKLVEIVTALCCVAVQCGVTGLGTHSCAATDLGTWHSSPAPVPVTLPDSKSYNKMVSIWFC